MRAVLWAATWGVGVALGVAVGGWLTVVGGAGAPGAGSLDLTEDVLVLPLLAGAAIFVVHVLGQLVAFGVRRWRAAREEHSDNEQSQ